MDGALLDVIKTFIVWTFESGILCGWTSHELNIKYGIKYSKNILSEV